MKCSLSDDRGPLGAKSKISGTSDVNSWTKLGATCSRAGAISGSTQAFT